MNNHFFHTSGCINYQDFDFIGKNLNTMRKGPVADVWRTVLALWKKATEQSANWSTRLLAVGALLYLISPLDAIPDPTPFVGLDDDAAVLMATAAKISNDLRKYL